MCVAHSVEQNRYHSCAYEAYGLVEEIDINQGITQM